MGVTLMKTTIRITPPMLLQYEPYFPRRILYCVVYLLHTLFRISIGHVTHCQPSRPMPTQRGSQTSVCSASSLRLRRCNGLQISRDIGEKRAQLVAFQVSFFIGTEFSAFYTHTVQFQFHFHFHFHFPSRPL